MTVDTSSEPFKAGAILPMLYWDELGHIWGMLYQAAAHKLAPQPFAAAQLAEAMYLSTEGRSM